MPIQELETGGLNPQAQLPVVPRHPITGEEERSDWARRISMIRQASTGPSGYPGSYDITARSSIMNLPPSVQHALMFSQVSDVDVRQFLGYWQAQHVRARAADEYQAFRDRTESGQGLTPDVRLGLGVKGSALAKAQHRAVQQLGLDPDLLDVAHAFQMGLASPDLIDHIEDAVFGPGERAMGYISNHVLAPPGRFLDHFFRTMKAMDYSLSGEDSIKGQLNPEAWVKYGERLTNFGAYWKETTSPEHAKKKFGVSSTLGQVAADSFGIKQGSGQYKAFSGMADFYIKTAVDPIVFGSQMRQGWKAVDLAISTSTKAQEKFFQTEGIQKAARMLAAENSPARVAKLARAMGADVGDQAVARIARAETSEEVLQVYRDGFAGNHGLVGQVRILPRAYQEPFGYLQRKMASFETPRLFRTLPRSGPVNTLASDAAREVQDLGRMFFPKDSERVQAYLDEFVAGGREERAALVQRIVDEGYAANGVTPELIAAARRNGATWAHYAEARQTFGVQLADSSLEEAPMFSPQRRYKISVPDYVALTRAKAGRLKGAYYGLEQAATEATGHVKTIWLMTGGFPARISLDEGIADAAYFHFRPSEYIKQLSTAWTEALTHSPNAFIQGMGTNLERLLDGMSRFPGFSSLKPLEEAPEVSPRVLMAAHGREFRFDGPVAEGVSVAEKDMLKEISRTHEIHPNDWVYVTGEHAHWPRMAYQFTNFHILNDAAGTFLVEHWGEGNLQRKIQDWLASEVGQTWKHDMRQTLGRLGKSAEEVVELQRQIIKRTIADHGLMDLAKTGEIGIEDLQKIPPLQRPAVPGFSVAERGRVSKIGQTIKHVEDVAFGPIAGLVDNMVRKPGYRILYEREYNRILDASRAAGTLGTEVTEDEIALAAHNYTARSQVPMIHDPSKRTAWDVHTRAYVPFSFAYVQFLKRWGKVLVENPGLVRRFSLLVDTGTNDGWFDKQSDGSLTWNIPVVGELASYVGQHVAHVPAHTFDDAFRVTVSRKEKEPTGALGVLERPFRMFNKAAVPPLLPFSSHTLPGFGPVLTIPVDFLTATRPDTESIRDFLLGPKAGVQPGEGVAQRILGQVVPSWMDKMATAFIGDEGDRNWANANKSALQWAAFHGMDLQDKKVQAKMRNVTKTLFLVRGALQFLSPYTPTPNTPGMQIVSEFRRLRTTYGPEIGLQKFMDKYGEKGFAYTIPFSQTAGKSVGFASDAAENFRNEHQGFFAQFPDVAGFFAPGGAFSSSAYNAQLESGERRTLTVQEWIEKYEVRKGNDAYFDVLKPVYQRYQAEVHTREGKAALALWLRGEQGKITKLYPGWGDFHAGWSTRAYENSQAVAQLQLAALDPSIAKTPQAQAIAEFMGSYNKALAKANDAGLVDLSSQRAAPLRDWLVSRYKEILGRSGSQQLQRVYELLFRNQLEDFEEKAA